MTSDTYVMELLNLTGEPWYFGSYQEYPSAPGLDSIIWKAAQVPLGGKTIFQWGMNYEADLTQYEGDHVTAQQAVPAKLGDTYQVITRDGILLIDPVPISTSAFFGLAIVNNTNPPIRVSVGSALSGSIYAAMKDLGPKQRKEIPAVKRYYVALFKSVQEGDIVGSDNSPVAPIQVIYPQGSNHAKITAYMDDGKTMTKVEYF